MAKQPLAAGAYERLAEAYSRAGATKFHNAFVDRPSTLALLGDARGLRVLDAGCGPGLYARELLDGGAARVLGLDASEGMIREARARCPEAEFRVHNLEEGLAGVADESFDAIVSGLALDYVEDWPLLFAELRRVLRPGGRLVYSLQHPIAAFVWYKREQWRRRERVEGPFRGFIAEPVPVPDYFRPLQEILGAPLAAGFILEEARDAAPSEAGRVADPGDFARTMERPPFLCLAWRRP